MAKKKDNPLHNWDYEQLCKYSIDSKDELLLLARDCPADAPLAKALEAAMDRSHGPELAQTYALRDHVEQWRDDGPVSEEWTVFVLLDLALQHAKKAPTVLEAAYPFMKAVAACAEAIEHNKGYRDEHWIAQSGNGECMPSGPPKEPVPSWIDREFLRQAEKKYRRAGGGGPQHPGSHRPKSKKV